MIGTNWKWRLKNCIELWLCWHFKMQSSCSRSVGTYKLGKKSKVTYLNNAFSFYLFFSWSVLPSVVHSDFTMCNQFGLERPKFHHYLLDPKPGQPHTHTHTPFQNSIQSCGAGCCYKSCRTSVSCVQFPYFIFVDVDSHISKSMSSIFTLNTHSKWCAEHWIRFYLGLERRCHLSFSRCYRALHRFESICV